MGFDNQHLGSLELQSIHFKTCLLSKPPEEGPSRTGGPISCVSGLKIGVCSGQPKVRSSLWY